MKVDYCSHIVNVSFGQVSNFFIKMKKVLQATYLIRQIGSVCLSELLGSEDTSLVLTRMTGVKAAVCCVMLCAE